MTQNNFQGKLINEGKKAFVSCNIVSSLSLVGFNVAFGNLIVCFKNVRVWVLVHVCENQSGKVLFPKLLIMFYTHLLPHNKRPCCLPCVLFKFESPPVLSLSNCSYYYETRKNLVSMNERRRSVFLFGCVELSSPTNRWLKRRNEWKKRSQVKNTKKKKKWINVWRYQLGRFAILAAATMFSQCNLRFEQQKVYY